jgi:hypothetical protein
LLCFAINYFVTAIWILSPLPIWTLIVEPASMVVGVIANTYAKTFALVAPFL